MGWRIWRTTFCGSPRTSSRSRPFRCIDASAPASPGPSNMCTDATKTSAKLKTFAARACDPRLVPKGWRVCRRGFPLTSQDHSDTRSGPFSFEGKLYYPGANRHWSISPGDRSSVSLVEKKRLYTTGKSLNAIMLLDDMPMTERGNVWDDTGTGSFTEDQLYVVQTSEKVVELGLFSWRLIQAT